MRELWDSGLTTDKIRKGGYTISDMKDAGFSLHHIINAGYPTLEMRNSGLTAREIYLEDPTILASTFNDGGYSPMDLKVAGFSRSNIECAGYSDLELTEYRVRACKQRNKLLTLLHFNLIKCNGKYTE